MSGIDIPYLAHCHNTGQEPTIPKPPPPYGDGTEIYHQHWHQAPVEAPRSKSWYKRPYVLAAIVAVLLVAIILGTALPIVLSASSARHRDPVITFSHSIVEETYSDKTVTVSQIVPQTSTKPSVITLIMTEPPASSSEEAATLTKVITQSGDDIGGLLSSLLPHYSLLSTQIVTLSETTEDESSTSSSASESTTSTTKPSSSASTTSLPTNESTKASSVTSPFSTRSPTTSTPPASTTTTSTSTPSASPISINTGLAAIDVNIGPSDLHRRLLLWQDSDQNLLARDSAKGTTNVYRVLDKIDSRARDKLEPIDGTAITAVAADDATVHVFYVTDNGQLVHLLQRRAGDWYYAEINVKVASDTRLSATWHTIGDSSGVMVIIYVDDKYKLSVLASETGLTDDWQITDVSAFEDRTLDDLQRTGISVISGVAYPNTTKSKPKLGDHADLSILLAGGGNTSWVNCKLSKSRIGECTDYTTGWFPDGEGDPVKESSHDVQVDWSAIRPSNGAPSTVYGFVSLDLKESTLSEYRMVPSSEEVSRRAAQLGKVRWETQDVTDKKVDAVAMTDQRALFALSGHDLYEFELEDNEWKMKQKVDSRLTDA